MAERDPELQRLIDESAIRKLLSHYPRGLDRHDSEVLASIYHADAIEDHGVFNGSAAAYVEWMAGRNAEGYHWMHNNTTQIIEIDGDVARAETYCLAFKRQPELDEQGRSREWLVRVRYLDRIEKRDGAWKIAHRRVVYAPNGVLTLDDVPATPESVVESGQGTDEIYRWSP
ncbi:MAG: nuclear transport factor 2 family protein [Ilumatobacteraceae bacterium]